MARSLRSRRLSAAVVEGLEPRRLFSTALQAGVTVNTTIGVANEQDSYTLNAVAGGTILVNLNEDSGTALFGKMKIRLLDPTGTEIASDVENNFDWGATLTSAPMTKTGTYTFVVQSTTTGTGAYHLTADTFAANYKVKDADDGGRLIADMDYLPITRAAALAAGDVDVFTSYNGERGSIRFDLKIDPASPLFGKARLRVIDPDGEFIVPGYRAREEIIATNTAFEMDAIDKEGTYTVVVDSPTGAKGNYSLVSITGPDDVNSGPTPVISNAPYVIKEGSGVTLMAAESGVGISPITYSWDINGNGVYGDATGAKPALTWAQLFALGIKGGKTYSMKVQASNSLATVNSMATTLTVNAVAATGPAVTGLTLYNADTDAAIGQLTDGMTIDLSTLSSKNVNVLAGTNPYPTGSVKFGWDATPGTFNANFETQVTAPYSLFKDDNGNLRPGTFAVGAHTLTATAYTGSNANGTAGTPVTVHFNLINSAPATPAAPTGLTAAASGTSITLKWTDKAGNETGFEIQRATNSTFTTGLTSVKVPTPNLASYTDSGLAASTTYYYRVRAYTGALNSAFTGTASAKTGTAAPVVPVVTKLVLINADTDTAVLDLVDGMTISKAAYAALKNFSVQAITSGTVGSVKFGYQGNASARIEGSAPWALFGDGGTGNYVGNAFAAGSYTVSATPYSKTGATGTVGAIVTIHFTVVA